MENNMKYEYRLYTWGGFYNDQHKLVHGEQEGNHFFDTKEERDAYLAKLQKLSKELNATMLAYDLSEGFTVRIPTVLHRIVEFGGKRYYSSREIHFRGEGYDSGYDYMLNWKWTPGFNDYPLGEDFDYSQEGFRIVQQWITGAFTVKPEQ